MLAVNVYPDLVQRICVTPNELAAERQQILNNIEMTRKAFGLEGIEQREYKVAESVTRASLENAGCTLNNVRLWDWAAAALVPAAAGIRLCTGSTTSTSTDT